MTSKRPILQMLQDGHALKRQGGLFCIAINNCPYLYTPDEVNAAHPHLLAALTFLTTHPQLQHMRFTCLSAAKTTLAHWTCPGTRCEELEHSPYIPRISKVMTTSPMDGFHVYVEDAYRVTNIQNQDGATVEVTSDPEAYSATISAGWFEKNFPGSTARMRMGLELGLDPEEIARMAFVISSEPTVSLPLLESSDQESPC